MNLFIDLQNLFFEPVCQDDFHRKTSFGEQLMACVGVSHGKIFVLFNKN